MCLNPKEIWVKRGPSFEKVTPSCGECLRCRQNYVSDWVGRCLAEATTAEVCCVLNLTYAPREDFADKVLTPDHMKLFFKRLRRKA